MQRMRTPPFDGDAGRVQRLTKHLAAENVRAAHEMAIAAEAVFAGLFQRQQAQDFLGIE